MNWRQERHSKKPRLVPAFLEWLRAPAAQSQAALGGCVSCLLEFTKETLDHAGARSRMGIRKTLGWVFKPEEAGAGHAVGRVRRQRGELRSRQGKGIGTEKELV